MLEGTGVWTGVVSLSLRRCLGCVFCVMQAVLILSASGRQLGYSAENHSQEN